MKRKRVIKATSWLLSIAFYVVVIGFASNQNEETRVQELEINLIQPENQFFITKENVSQIIGNEYDSIEGKPLNLINTALLEESIENHPLIEDAEVYFTLDGRVSVDVVQETALARVREANRDVYMSIHGKAIPRSLNHSANVPMITGHIDSSHWQEAYHFLRLLDDSSWLGNNIEALERDSSGLYRVYPRFGRHHIVWGDLDEVDRKLKKLHVFYSYLEENETLNDIKTIDVRFNDQVVSTKY